VWELRRTRTAKPSPDVARQNDHVRGNHVFTGKLLVLKGLHTVGNNQRAANCVAGDYSV